MPDWLDQQYLWQAEVPVSAHSPASLVDGYIALADDKASHSQGRSQLDYIKSQSSIAEIDRKLLRYADSLNTGHLKPCLDRSTAVLTHLMVAAQYQQVMTYLHPVSLQLEENADCGQSIESIYKEAVCSAQESLRHLEANDRIDPH